MGPTGRLGARARPLDGNARACLPRPARQPADCSGGDGVFAQIRPGAVPGRPGRGSMRRAHARRRRRQVGAIHAGLECGILGAKVPGMDMVSYGPTIRGAHSPEERVEVATVAPFWEATLRLLGRLAERRA